MKKSVTDRPGELCIDNVDSAALQKFLAEVKQGTDISDLILRSIKVIDACYLKYNHELNVFKVLLQYLVSSTNQYFFNASVSEKVMELCISKIVEYQSSDWFLSIKNAKGFTLLYFLRGSEFKKVRDLIEKHCPSDAESSNILWERMRQVTEGKRSVQDMFRDEICSPKPNYQFIRYLCEDCSVLLAAEPYRSIHPLHVLIQNEDNYQILKYLVQKCTEQGVDVNAVDQAGRTLFSIFVDLYWKKRSPGEGSPSAYYIPVDFLSPILSYYTKVFRHLVSTNLVIDPKNLDYRGWCFISYVGFFGHQHSKNKSFIERWLTQLGEDKIFKPVLPQLLFDLAKHISKYPEIEQMIFFFLQGGTIPQQKDENGNTFLSRVLISEKCCKVLLEAGSNPNESNNIRTPAFHNIFDFGILSSKVIINTLKLLQSYGADLFLRPPESTFVEKCGEGEDEVEWPCGGENLLDKVSGSVSGKFEYAQAKEVFDFIVAEMKSRITQSRMTVMWMRTINASCFFEMPKEIAKKIALEGTEEHSEELKKSLQTPAVIRFLNNE